MARRTKKKSVPKRKRQIPKPTKQDIGLLGRALRGLGGLGGAAVGTLVGAPAAGRAAGTDLGAHLSRWLGSGDYEVTTNTIVDKASNGIPYMHKTGQTVTIRHREFIGTISGSVDFTVQHTFVINPGNPYTFPWLSAIAARFQEYDIKGAVFHYVPTSGTAVSSTSAALGSVMIQTSYRSTDPPPANKVEILNEYFASEGVPSVAFVHPLECNPKENPFNIHYVRSGDTTVTEPLMYDLGVTRVCTQGMQSVYTVGDLWLTYEIELKKPLVSSPATLPPLCYTATYAPLNTSNLFNVVTPILQSLPIVTDSTNGITFPDGSYGSYLLVVTIDGMSGANPQWQGALTVPANVIDNSVALIGGQITTNGSGTISFQPGAFIAAVTKTDNQSARVQFPAPANTTVSSNSGTLCVVYMGPS